MNQSTQDAQLKLASLYKEMQALIDEITQLQQQPDNKVLLEDLKLNEVLFEKRKQQRVSLEDLELQTDISFSTVHRILKDPLNAKLANVHSICNELGVKIWIEK